MLEKEVKCKHCAEFFTIFPVDGAIVKHKCGYTMRVVVKDRIAYLKGGEDLQKLGFAQLKDSEDRFKNGKKNIISIFEEYEESDGWESYVPVDCYNKVANDIMQLFMTMYQDVDKARHIAREKEKQVVKNSGNKYK